MQRLLAAVQLKAISTPPKFKVFKFFYRMVLSDKFDLFIMLIIVLNTITLCMDYVGESKEYANALDVANIVFVSIFTIECACKLLGLRPKFYFTQPWN
jgi:hypothetical protein